MFNQFLSEKEITVKSFKTITDTPNQPIGLNEVIEGSIQRAKYVFNIAKNEKNPSFFCIGIEAGLVRIPETISGFLDYQFCSIMDEKMRLSLGSGSGWQYPKFIVEKLLSDRSIEVAEIMTELSKNPEIKYHNGAIGYFSKNRINRLELTKQCVQMALIPFMNDKLYFHN